MIRMTVTLCVALWAVFVIWGDPATKPTENLANQERETGDAQVIETASTFFDQPTVVNAQSDNAVVSVTRAAASGTSVPRLIGEPVRVSLVQPEAPVAPDATVAEASALPLYEVTGNRVNLRAGPSTSNGVVGALTRGAMTEALGQDENGWMEIRDIETGLTGFMASRFLSAL